jgi:WD40 repeat protein
MSLYSPTPLALGLVLALFPGVPVQQPERLKPTNLSQVNTDKDEDDPHLSSDGLQLYYSTNARGKFDIRVSTRRARMQAWPPGNLVEGNVQTPADDRSVFATPEGRFPQYLYFATKKDLLPEANFDIYVAVRQNRRADFTSPTPLNSVCTAEDELHPWLTVDGRQLYFSRKTRDGWRVFVASRPKGGLAAGFGAPRAVDLPAGFHHATLTADGRTMYLQGPLDKDRWGLFRTVWTGSRWAGPEPLTALNHPEGPTGDRSPCLSRDGAMLYFASDRPGGKGGLDLWGIPTAELNKKADGKAEGPGDARTKKH